MAVLSVGACSQGPEDRIGNEMRSDSTGERNERLGNDPAQQNTGGESNPEDRALREDAPAPR
jgi:hypothetical protein